MGFAARENSLPVPPAGCATVDKPLDGLAETSPVSSGDKIVPMFQGNPEASGRHWRPPAMPTAPGPDGGWDSGG